jgi:uncharacterized protein (DUF1330 family)
MAMAAYLVVELIDIADNEALGQYVEQIPVMVERHGGRYLARGPVTVLEGDHQPQILVIVEFQTLEQLQALYHSEEYAPMKALRQRACTSNFLAVDGL